MRNQLLHGYEVQTCTNLPTKDGEIDYDGATYRTFDCPTKPDAVKLAKHLLPKDCWGAVTVTEFVREPYEPGCPALRKEYTSDPEYVEA